MKNVNSINKWEVFYDEDRLLGFDGSRWIFEYLNPEGYKIRDVWSPSDKFYHLGIFLFNLSGIKENIY